MSPEPHAPPAAERAHHQGRVQDLRCKIRQDLSARAARADWTYGG